MRIVYVLESLEMSGGVKVIVEHAEGLAGRGHDVALVTKDARHDWIPIRVSVIEVPCFNATTLPEAEVHVATWFSTVVPTVHARRAPRIFHFSQGYEALYPNVFHRQDEIEEAYRVPVPKLLISRHLKDLFEGRFPGALYVLPQTLRAERYRPLELRPASRVPPVVGVVGPFELSIKGVPSSLRAVARLRDAGRAVILHRASLMPMLEAERAMGPCDLYAHAISVDEMADWYRRLDLLLFSSTDAEGFGLPPLEAMAAGVPVVISDIPSLAVLPGDAVSRVPVGDSVAMAREAARLLDDPGLWAERRARGLEVARTFTIDAVLDRLEEIFSQKTS
ncbi:MAG: glycosyltransferase family 4 protein [Thermoanaerobaculia bacterium]